MKRTLMIFATGFVLGTGFGAAGWYLGSPLFIDNVVSETLTTEAEVLASGSLRDADRAHRGTGDVSLVRLPDGRVQVQLAGFEVTNGPDLEVWLSASADPQASADVANAEWLSLGQLKGNIGDQAYDVPAEADLSAYGSLVIWCEQFGVLFASAPLS